MKKKNFKKFATSILISSLMFADISFSSEFQDSLYDKMNIEASGFLETRNGMRVENDPNQKGMSVSEVRLQIGLDTNLDWAGIVFKGDLLADGVEKSIENEIREFNISFTPLDPVDFKIGRQALTWGTGDLLFINDLFPKDWESFFIGRDDEYLKAPVDALKMGIFLPFINLDISYMPRLNESNYIDGERLSYFNPLSGNIAGNNFIMEADTPDRYFKDDEIAIRLSRRFRSMELSVYGYKGYWKTPEGFNPSLMILTYPDLSVYGASARGPLWGGVGNIEAGYYNSGDDKNGDKPGIRNSETRFLAGFEREVLRNLTAVIQYYIEWMDDFGAYKKSIKGSRGKDEFRHVITIRLTKLLLNQNMRLSFFAYYSPSDEDAYFRPKIHYKLTDTWAVETGANIFTGRHDDTFFGQFEKNNNIYLGLRIGF